jgi:TRAP-type C4-dicarboxylate transport system substrate-binding protein
MNTYPGGTLLGAKNMMDGVIAGQADIGNLCMAYQPGRFIVTNATSLPLGMPNSKGQSWCCGTFVQKYQPEAFAKVKVLAMFTTAPTNIMSKVPVRTLEDIKGLDLRASGGAAQILKAWGANPVGMPMPATVEALQKGVVKGLYSSLEVMKDFKFAESCKYVTKTDTVIYPFAVVMNMDSWNALPKDVQAVMDACASSNPRGPAPTWTTMLRRPIPGPRTSKEWNSSNWRRPRKPSGMPSWPLLRMTGSKKPMERDCPAMRS